jgi:hypothetical protein
MKVLPDWVQNGYYAASMPWVNYRSKQAIG